MNKITKYYKQFSKNQTLRGKNSSVHPIFFKHVLFHQNIGSLSASLIASQWITNQGSSRTTLVWRFYPEFSYGLPSIQPFCIATVNRELPCHTLKHILYSFPSKHPYIALMFNNPKFSYGSAQYTTLLCIKKLKG